MRLIDIEPILNNAVFHTWKKKDLVLALESAPAVGVVCTECLHKDTTVCPAYDAPMRRTSLRIRSCSEGERHG